MIPRFCDRLQHAAPSVIHLVQHVGALLSNQQRSNSRREAKHFVEGQHDEIGGEFCQVEVVRGNVSSGVEKNVPVPLAVEAVLSLNLRNPMQWEDLAGKVLFEREREQIVHRFGVVAGRIESLTFLLDIRAANDVKGGSIVQRDLANTQH